MDHVDFETRLQGTTGIGLDNDAHSWHGTVHAVYPGANGPKIPAGASK